MRGRRTDVPPNWTDVWALGAELPASVLVRRWLEALRASPGLFLVLEQEESPWGRALRVRAPPEVLGAAGGSAPSSPYRLVSRPPGSVPLPPGQRGPCAFGLVRWKGEASGGGEGPGTPLPPFSIPGGRPVGDGPGPVPGRWMVQGMFWASVPDRLQASVRLLGEANDVRGAIGLRDRRGVALAAELGARFEPWAPGSAAHAHAWREWERHAVDRFGSGPLAPPGEAVLASPWRVPAFPYAPGASSGAGATEGPAGRELPLGTSWRHGRAVGLSLPSLLRHVAVVGTTGSGKTQLLAHVAAESALRLGVPFVLFDLHGDLGPAVVARMGPRASEAVAVMDATRRPGDGVVGMDVMEAGGAAAGTVPEEVRPSSPVREVGLTPAEEDLLSGEVLSALRPSPGGGEEYWGPRMERFLESGIRAVLQEGGNLRDVADLLYHPLEHAPRLAQQVRNPALADGLRELPSLLRRQPDLLASSQNRLSKVHLSPRVAELVACEGPRKLRPEVELARGRSVVVHLPKGELGEGISLTVANLLLARTYLGLLRRPSGSRGASVSVLLVLDEAQGFSPRLLRAIVEEGRKFGVACVLATQSASRLERLFPSAPLDAVGTLIALRLPPAEALRVTGSLAVGGHVGSGGASEGTLWEGPRGTMRGARSGDAWPSLAEQIVTLPPHAAWVRCDGEGRPELLALPGPVPGDVGGWSEASERSAREHGNVRSEERGAAHGPGSVAREAERAVLLCAARAQALGAPLDLGELPQVSSDRSTYRGGRSSRWELEEAERQARARRWIVDARTARGTPTIDLTPAGWARLGYRDETGAPRESEEHRRLLWEAFRFFVRQGIALELPPQGGFARRAPDGILRILPGPEETQAWTPTRWWEELDRTRRGPLWAFSNGRDVHLEAEVSGVRQAERLRRSLEKGRGGRVLVLFLVGSESDAGRLRSFLQREGAGPDRARVWVLPPHPYSSPEGPEGWRST